MKIVIIGARGQLGTDLVAHITQQNTDTIIALAHSDCDITKQRAIATLTKFAPDMVINLAAYHAVDDCEINPQRPYEVNVFAIKRLVDFCLKTNTTLVQLSTDYVYGRDATRKKPYTESDPPAPINLYGHTRAVGEYLVQKHLKKFFLIRTSGLYGTATSSMKQGGNFVELMISKATRGETIQVVDDQVASPTYTRFLAIDIYALIRTKHYGLYHIVSQGSCSWYTFAKEIFSQLGIKAKLKATTTKQYNTPAIRPAYSVLGCNKLKALGLYTLPNWKKALSTYLVDTGRMVY